MTTRAVPGSSVAWLTDEEAVGYFDKQVRSVLGISGAEFIERWDRGELDPDDHSVLSLSMLLPFGRRLSR